MSYVDKHLIPGETVEYQTNLHWIVMLGHAGLAAFFLLAGVALLVVSFGARQNTEYHSSVLVWPALGVICCRSNSLRSRPHQAQRHRNVAD